jgi:hypothetical protein
MAEGSDAEIDSLLQQARAWLEELASSQSGA